MPHSDIREKAIGRWKGILSQFGLDQRYLNGRHGPCPLCQVGKDCYQFTDKDGRGTYVCRKCSMGDGWNFLQHWKKWDFREAVEKVGDIIGEAKYETVKKTDPDKVRDSLRQMWINSKPTQKGDVVDTYLRSRKINLDTFPKTMRTATRLEYWLEDHARLFFPAMLLLVEGPDNQGCSIHRTYLLPDGSGKADVEEPRRVTKGELKKGCAIRLAEPQEFLGIAEGAETALAASLIFKMPVWSAINSTMLEQWQPPESVKSIFIFGDHDKTFTGQASAYALAKRLACDQKNARQVYVKIPPNVGDWNDKL